jgi:FtsP/CotA-like multicopper oxidase with cupredoxin domain
VKSLRRRGLGALALPALAGLGLLGGGAIAAGPSAQVREYWIAAVPVTWNVVPNGRNAIEGETFSREETTFKTIVYRRYTKDWVRPLRDNPKVVGDNDGIPGPLLRARVGDRILVHFKNLDNEFERPHSMHFHGVEYAVGSDGAFLPGFSGPGANVRPGESFTYRLKAGPQSAGIWPYHDHSPSMTDSIDGGLYGALSILGPRQEPPDREFVVFFGKQLEFNTINGRAFVGNTPIFRAKLGDVVQWDVLAIGDDHHTFHVHGHRWLSPSGVPEDTRTIGPAESFAVRWKEGALGTWLYHCHVESHMMNGMISFYRVGR